MESLKKFLTPWKGKPSLYPKTAEYLKKLDCNEKKLETRIERFNLQVLDTFSWNEQNITIVHYAAANLNVNQLHRILKKAEQANKKNFSINVNETSTRNWNALHYAAHYSNDAEIIAKLCNIGVDANVRENQNGDTPIMLAIDRGNLEAVKILSEFSQISDTKDNKDKTAIDKARDTNKLHIVDFLEKQQRDNETDRRINAMTAVQTNLQATVVDHGNQLVRHERLISAMESGQNRGPGYRQDSGFRSSCNNIESSPEYNYPEARNLRLKYHLLCDQMRPNDMIIKLYAYGIVTTTFKQRFSTWDTDERKNMEILDHIIKGPKMLYDGFIRVLQETDQQHIVDLIEQ